MNSANVTLNLSKGRVGLLILRLKEKWKII